jgi:hypothetical protein
VELVLLESASVSQSWCVEDANLEKPLCILITSTNASTYHDAVAACKFVSACRVGLALIVRTTLLIGVVEDVEVVVINVVTDKDIGDKFQDRGLSDTGLSKKKDGGA